jgi:hypothetical protein
MIIPLLRFCALLIFAVSFTASGQTRNFDLRFDEILIENIEASENETNSEIEAISLSLPPINPGKDLSLTLMIETLNSNSVFYPIIEVLDKEGNTISSQKPDLIVENGRPKSFALRVPISHGSRTVIIKTYRELLEKNISDILVKQTINNGAEIIYLNTDPDVLQSITLTGKARLTVNMPDSRRENPVELPLGLTLGIGYGIGGEPFARSRVTNYYTNAGLHMDLGYVIQLVRSRNFIFKNTLAYRMELDTWTEENANSNSGAVYTSQLGYKIPFAMLSVGIRGSFLNRAVVAGGPDVKIKPSIGSVFSLELFESKTAAYSFGAEYTIADWETTEGDKFDASSFMVYLRHYFLK